MTAEDMNKDDDLGSEGSDEGARPGETEDDAKSRKRKERLEQNRISARESRKRKKTMIEELQRTVITLSRENKDLNERNETLRRNLMEIGAKYPNIVPLQALVGQGAAQAAATDGSNPGALGGAPAAAPAAPASALSAFNPLQWFPGATAPAPAAAGAAAPTPPAPTNQANV